MINRDLEFKILHFFLQDINFYTELPNDFFADRDSKHFYTFLQLFVKKYRNIPTEQIILDQKDETVKFLYYEIINQKATFSEFSYYAEKIYENYIERRIYAVGEIITAGLYTKTGETLRQNIINEVSGIRNPFLDVGSIIKRYYWETAKDRWQQYKEVEKNPDKVKALSWGIDAFDEMTNGAQPRWLICFYGQSKSGKSRFMANLAFNQAVLSGADVMWIAREMSITDMERVFDTRYALLDQNIVRDGKLIGQDRSKYLHTLQEVHEKKPPLYIVDIPYECSTIEIEQAILDYYYTFRKFPKAVYMDYANLIVPAAKYSTTSERFNFLFKELHEIPRKYNLCFITAVQEGREGMKVKNKEEVGIQHIGLSHYIVPHVELMLHLYQDSIDEYTHTLRCVNKAGRYVRAGAGFSTFAFFECNYVGDRKIKQIETKEEPNNNGSVTDAELPAVIPGEEYEI